MVLFGSQAVADTTNRALQVSPVPGVFVGGVGLLCENTDRSVDNRQYFLITKSRTTFGWADFSRMTTSAMRSSRLRVSRFYRMSDSGIEIVINRKTWRLSFTLVRRLNMDARP